VHNLHRVSDGASDVKIRVERAGDEHAIADVVEAAFGSPVEARLVAALRASDAFIPELSLVAERDERIVGHVMISSVALRADDGTERRIASLSPLAVAPDDQRAGVGSSLVRAVTARADELGEPLVVLEGSPVYYGRFGFEHSVPHGIRINLPSWAPAEAAQVLRLTGYDPELQGVVVYPPAFDEAIEH
jgi:putative acetyltransferase